MAKSKIKPWHLLAAMFGATGLLLGFLGAPHSALVGIGLPVASALLVGWLLVQIVPKPVVAAFILVVAVVQGVRYQSQARRASNALANERRAREMVAICDGTPVTMTPTGNAKIRVLIKREVNERAPSWLDQDSWNIARVPDLVLCVKETTEQVSSGMFHDTTHPNDPPLKISTRRYLADVELRKLPSAEVVFSKHYLGSEPPALPTSVQFGGKQSTLLSGDRVAYATIYDDIKPLLGR